MNIYINSQQTVIELDKESSIGNALIKIDAWCAAEKVIVKNIKIDNAVYNSKEMSHLCISDVKTMEVDTQPQQQFLNEVIHEVLEYIPRLKKGIENSYTCFQSANIDDGIAWFNQCIDGIEWTNSVLSKLNLIFNRNPERLAQYDNISDEFIKFNAAISEIFKAMNNEDYVSIGDILEYDIISSLDNFTNFLSDIQNIKE